MVRLPRVAAHMSGWLERTTPELPTRAVQWTVQTKRKFEELSPYTAPISAYRGRSLASRLELRLPIEGTSHGIPEVIDSHESSRHHGLLQLRYPLSFPTSLTYPPPLAHQYLLPLSPDGSACAIPSDPPCAHGPPSTHRPIPPSHTRTAHLSAYAKRLFTEDFDTYVADVAARHVDLHDKALVTAYLDSLVWYQHTHPHRLCSTCDMPDSHQHVGTGAASQAGVSAVEQVPRQGCDACQPLDLYLTGQVTWVGTSSIEVTIELTHDDVEATDQADISPVPTPPSPSSSPGTTWDSTTTTLTPPTPSSNAPQVLIARARFIMAARDPSLKKAAPVPKLVLENDKERRLYEDGATRQKSRHGGRKQEASLPLSDPVTSAMRDLIVSGLHRHTHAQQGQGHGHISALMPATAAGTNIDIHRTVHSTAITQSFLTQFQERNTTGTVFGGQLLLYGQEMSELVVAALVGCPCELLFIRDVPFLSLVPLGHMVRVNGKVVATKGQLVVTHVRTYRSETALQTPTSPSRKHHLSRSSQGTNTATGGQPSTRPTVPADDHGHHGMVQTHSFWCAFRAPDAVQVPAVVPMTLHELEQWSHAMHLLTHQGL